MERRGGDGQNPRPDGTTVVLALYKFDSCPYCQKVFRAIDALNVNVEYRDIRKDATWRQDLYQHTNRTTVPCLKIDDRYLHESTDIVAWLRRHYPPKPPA